MSKRQPFTGSTDALAAEVEEFFRLVGPALAAGQHFKIEREADGVARLYLRFRLVYPFYKQAAAQQGIAPFSAQALRSWLTASPFFLQDRPKGVRFAAEPNATSALVFDHGKLRAAGVTLS